MALDLMFIIQVTQNLGFLFPLNTRETITSLYKSQVVSRYNFQGNLIETYAGFSTSLYTQIDRFLFSQAISDLRIAMLLESQCSYCSINTIAIGYYLDYCSKKQQLPKWSEMLKACKHYEIILIRKKWALLKQQNSSRKRIITIPPVTPTLRGIFNLL